MLSILTHRTGGQIISQEHLANLVELLCDIADGKTTSFERDLLEIGDCFNIPKSKTKLNFNDFWFYKNCYKYYRTELLILDFVLFFETNKHSDVIIDSKSNYSLKKMEKLLYMLENHRKELKIIKNDHYFKSFSAHFISRCLYLTQQYGYKSDIFQKIFGVLISFIKKHECVVGNKSPMFMDKIYQSIVANHYYGALINKQLKNIIKIVLH